MTLTSFTGKGQIAITDYSFGIIYIYLLGEQNFSPPSYWIHDYLLKDEMDDAAIKHEGIPVVCTLNTKDAKLKTSKALSKS